MALKIPMRKVIVMGVILSCDIWYSDVYLPTPYIYCFEYVNIVPARSQNALMLIQFIHVDIGCELKPKMPFYTN